jgi:predicted molibdopterin-dependent oxidoreductase YjgC
MALWFSFTDIIEPGKRGKMDKDIINLTVHGRDFQGKKVQGRRGQTVLEVFRENGIYVPTLCFHP